MKRLISVIILAAICLTALSSCKKSYEPVESTEEESRVVMTVSVGEQQYDVKYELYRTMFLTYRSLVDGGNTDAWSGDGKDRLIAEINGLIIERVAQIYGAIELARRIGYDVYSDEADGEIDEMIRVSVDGGSYNGVEYIGYGGDYDAYLSDLSSVYHNYSTSVLMLRYELAMSAIEEYYIGKADEVLTDGSFTGGALEYTYEDIERYYYSDSCARVLRTYLTEGVSYDTAARAESVRQDLVNEAAKGEGAVAAMMINRGTPTAANEILSGVLFGEHSSADEYQKLADVALELNEGEVSEVVYLYTASDGGRYYILYRAEKTDDFLESSYSEVVYTYLYDSVGKMIDNIADLIADGMNTTDGYFTIDHASISMDR